MKRQHKGGDNRFTQKRGKCYDQSATEKLGVQMESERGRRGRGTMRAGTLAILIGCVWRYNHPKGPAVGVAPEEGWSQAEPQV